MRKSNAAGVLSAVFLVLIIPWSDVWCDEKSGEKGRSLMALPVAGYSTDTGFVGGAAAIKSYNRDRIRISTIKTAAIYTANKQFTSVFEIDHYFPANRDRVLLNMNYVKYPTYYYGLGNDSSNDDPEKYTPEFFDMEFFYERSLKNAFKFKTGFFFHKEALVEFESDGNFIGSDAPWKRGRLDAGPEFSFIRDSRDNINATQSGSLVQVRYRGLMFQDEGGSSNKLTMEARKFYNPHPDIVIGFMALNDNVRGDTPHYLYPTLGGQDRLRGYEENRFQDRSRILFQQDIRFTLWGPIGGCFFAATGRVAPDVESLFSGTWHSAAGCGIRWYYNREDNLPIRIDIARGSDANGVYFGFGEAF